MKRNLFAAFAAAVIIVVAALWFVTLLFGGRTDNRTDASLTTRPFVSADLGVKLNLPPTWRVEESTGSAEFITPNGRIVLKRAAGKFGDVQARLAGENGGTGGKIGSRAGDAGGTGSRPDTDQVFFFSRGGWVYYLAADSPRLFDQLLFVLGSLEFSEAE
ncbi:MAG: hypothetical protein COU69_04475 [Candidatus Pacebacteria bacterium CG10_big_fil_rev_8_21_14_0_10_56_10]|nr:MAG: hypothetical protein COU69_04475 [Candidatus Pacebacteria bacterium CG10_big_fil_rev_8_21_14_0_10_56_10]